MVPLCKYLYLRMIIKNLEIVNNQKKHALEFGMCNSEFLSLCGEHLHIHCLVQEDCTKFVHTKNKRNNKIKNSNEFCLPTILNVNILSFIINIILYRTRTIITRGLYVSTHFLMGKYFPFINAVEKFYNRIKALHIHRYRHWCWQNAFFKHINLVCKIKSFSFLNFP